MGIILGDFAGGVGQGLEQGQAIRERYQKMAQEAVARRADQAYQNWLLSPGTNPIGPAPGGPPGGMPTPMGPQGAPPPGQPPGGPPGQPQSVPMPGAQPMPMAAGAPPPPPPQAQGPQAAPTGATPASAPPRPAAPPPAVPPTGAPLGAGLPPQGASAAAPKPGMPAPQDDPVMQSKAAIQSIAKEIAQANPGRKWKPGELLDAVNDALGQMKTLDPTAAKIAQLQIEYYRANLQAQTAGANREERGREADERTSVQAGGLAERIRRDQSTELNAAHRTDIYGEMAQNSHQDRLAAIEAMNDRAAASNDSREKIALTKEAGTMQRFDEAIENKDWATVAQIQAGNYRAQAGNAPAGQAGKAPAIAAPPKTAGRTAGRTQGGGEAVPPFPPTKNGQIATSPSGRKFVARGGAWVPQ